MIRSHKQNYHQCQADWSGIIRRNFKSCSSKIKSHLHQSSVHPKLEFGVCGWATFTEEERKQLEGIQRYAARMCCNNYTRTASVTAMMKDLEWPLLEKHRIIARLTMLYQINHGLVEIQHDLKPQSRNHRRYHQFSYHRPNAKTKFYSTSFYPSTLPHWNNLPESVVSLPKLSLFKEAMSKIILGESKIILGEGNQN